MRSSGIRKLSGQCLKHQQLSDHTPHGIDVETIRRMLLDTHFQIPTVDDKMILKVRKELGLSKKNLNYSGIMQKAQKKWKNLSRQGSCCYSHDVFFKNGF